MKHFSIVGRGYHTDETVTGFYSAGDRVKFWGSRGAYWGGLWGLLFGGMMLTIPVIGPVVVLGSLGRGRVHGHQRSHRGRRRFGGPWSAGCRVLQHRHPAPQRSPIRDGPEGR